MVQKIWEIKTMVGELSNVYIDQANVEYIEAVKQELGDKHYRAFPQDAIQNMNYSKTNLTMPVLALGGGYIPTFGGNITMPTIIYGMKILAQNVTGVTVPNSGHFIPDEQPKFLVEQLTKFFRE
jgi:pimeloyl-ACP methyl ester carboxylesterase